ncbi:MAG: hypothetical protein P8Y45_21275 [Exilibacterium sp.]
MSTHADSHHIGGTWIKRHVCLLVLTPVTLLLIGILGFLLSHHPEWITRGDHLATTNNPYLLWWRIVFYLVVIAAWKPVLLRLKSPAGKRMSLVHTELIQHSRRKLITGIACYELFIAQNLPADCLHGIWRGLYGG